MENNKSTDLVAMNNEVVSYLQDDKVKRALLATTFKGLDEANMRKAAMEGMMRGFRFEDFLKKNIYAVPFGGGYSLITSIDYNRKLGMRSGVVGISEPTYEMDGSTIVSCTITVKRKIDDYIGEYTAKVYFSEYSSGTNLWKSKPRTMIAKVAEMHALRKACPEELSQSYVEEEMEKEILESGRPAARLKEALVDADALRIGSITKNGKNKGKKAEAKDAHKNEAPDAKGGEAGAKGSGAEKATN